MAKAYQRTYTQLQAITKATISLNAKGVANDELATVNGKLAQIVKTKGDLVTLQVFSGTEGVPTEAEVSFQGAPPTIKVSEQLAGRSSTHTANRLTEVRRLKERSEKSAALR